MINRAGRVIDVGISVFVFGGGSFESRAGGGGIGRDVDGKLKTNSGG